MSKAKYAAPSPAPDRPSGYSSWSFAQGFLLGQFTLAFILFCFIKFFIFGDPPSADSQASARAAVRRQRTLSHSATLRRKSFSDRKRASGTFGTRHISTASSGANVLTTDKILEKTYYNVDGHQPESLDWFNVLIAQTIAQLRADALEGDAVLSSLTSVLNGSAKPDFLDDIRVTEISLGEEFPIFSNCRVIPVDENGAVLDLKKLRGRRGGPLAGLGESRLQARMDVDLSDVVTLGVETKLVLNYPKPFVAVLPVALSVSVVRFSGTLSMSFTPSQPPPQPSASDRQSQTSTDQDSPTSRSQNNTTNPENESSTSSHSPTTLTFTFLDDYRLDLSVHSLIGSRSRLQDVPKIAQLVEQRLHAWFDERCVEPRFQQIILPSLWPRKQNVRGGEGVDPEPSSPAPQAAPTDAPASTKSSKANLDDGTYADNDTPDLTPPARTKLTTENLARNASSSGSGAGLTSQRQRPVQSRRPAGAEYAVADEQDDDPIAEAGAEMRAADARDRERERREQREKREREGVRRRANGLGDR